MSYGFFTRYVNCVERNLKMNWTEMDFKSDPGYTEILEHVSAEQGEAYLNAIKREFGFWFVLHKEEWIELCKQNDQIGKPHLVEYEDFCVCSPSNLRYLHHALLILTYIRDNDLDVDDVETDHDTKEFHVAEIGGGYGGLSFFLFNLASLFDVKIDTYTVFDLGPIEELQIAYCEYHGINLTSAPTGKPPQDEYFLISDYALGEMPDEVQQPYIDEFVKPYCTHGFLTWNGKGTLDVEGARIRPEEPRTGHNHYIYF